MASYMLVSNKWSAFLYGNLESLRKEGVLCDVTLQGNDGKTLLAHSSVLAAASSVLKSCLVQAPRGHYVVKIPTITSHMWDLLLSFIYCGRVKVTAAERSEMTGAAQMLGLAELLGLCEAPVVATPGAVQYNKVGPMPVEALAVAQPGTSTSNEDNFSQNLVPLNTQELGTKNDVDEPEREDVDMKPDDLFNNKQVLNEYKRSKYTCGECGKSFPWGKALNIHELMHKQKTGAKHVCSMCNKEFNTFHSLRAHERTHTYQPFKCSICFLGFHFQVNYDLHMKKEHLVETDVQHKCEICEKEFNAKGLLSRHMSTAHGIKKTPVKKTSTGTKSVKSKQICKCYECDEEFDNRDICKEHFQDTHEVDPFFCEVCDVAFSTDEDLTNHYDIHTKEGSTGDCIKCNICAKLFKHLFALKCHQTEVHNKNEVPKCDICGMQAKSMRLLAKHMRIHEGQVNENLWRCALCNAEFDNRPDFGMHVAEHRGEKVYNCKYCSKGFTHKGNYTTHMQRHLGIKPFVCQFCKKTFVRKEDMRSHLRVHTGEKPFECQVCKMKFACISNLREHERAKHNTTFSKRNPHVTVPRQHRQRVKYRAKNVAPVNIGGDDEMVGLVGNAYNEVENDQSSAQGIQIVQNINYGSTSGNQDVFTVQETTEEGDDVAEGEYYQVIEDDNGVQTLAPISNPSSAAALSGASVDVNLEAEEEGSEHSESVKTEVEQDREGNEEEIEEEMEEEGDDNEGMEPVENKHGVQTNLVLEAEDIEDGEVHGEGDQQADHQEDIAL